MSNAKSKALNQKTHLSYEDVKAGLYKRKKGDPSMGYYHDKNNKVHKVIHDKAAYKKAQRETARSLAEFN